MCGSTYMNYGKKSIHNNVGIFALLSFSKSLIDIKSLSFQVKLCNKSLDFFFASHKSLIYRLCYNTENLLCH